MAIEKSALTPAVWANPIWPDPLPKSSDLRLRYGVEADELVVLFEDFQGCGGVFDFIDTPDESYAAIKIGMDSVAVIGVLVYPLAALAIELHPEWRPALAPCPSPAVANRIVLDIKELYDQYGLIPDTAEVD